MVVQVRSWSVVGVVAFILMGASPATAQALGIDNPDDSTPVTMYFHIDAKDDFPINTQPPDEEYSRAEQVGLTGFTTTCIPDPAGQLGMVRQSYHTLYGFSTPGYVEYGFSEQGGPRIHPERGLAKNVELDRSADARVVWYMQTQAFGDNDRTPGEAESAPLVVPQVTVHATIREGDDVSVGDAAYNEGPVIASGQSEPMMVMPDDANPHYHELPDGRHLYEFVVPLDLTKDKIPKEEAFNIRIDTTMQVPGCDSSTDESLMASNMRLHTSPDFRPRLEWSITNPLQIEYVHPQFVGDDLVIHTAISSPWGNYDVDESVDGLQITIEGPSDARSLARTAYVQRHHEHGYHFEPVDVTFSWRYQFDNAREGEYVVELSAWNDQRTAQAVGRAGFVLGENVGIADDGSRVERVELPDVKESPAPLLGPGLLLAVAFVMRRRSRSGHAGDEKP